MRTNILTKYFILAILAVNILVPSHVMLYAVTPEEEQEARRVISGLPKAEPPQELRAERSHIIVVKFIQGADIQGILDEAGIRPLKSEEIAVVMPAESLVAAGAAKKETLVGHSDSWYWFAGKNYKKEEGSQSRQEETDSFNLGYRITLEETMTAAEAINKLRANPNVEYAVPNEYTVE